MCNCCVAQRIPHYLASQVPSPEPPKMEMVTEDYKPLNFIIERIKEK